MYYKESKCSVKGKWTSFWSLSLSFLFGVWVFKLQKQVQLPLTEHFDYYGLDEGESDIITSDIRLNYYKDGQMYCILNTLKMLR